MGSARQRRSDAFNKFGRELYNCVRCAAGVLCLRRQGRNRAKLSVGFHGWPGQTATSSLGIYRSDNARRFLATHQRQPTSIPGLGSILDLCGDPRVFGRVYFGTEGRGIIYGDLATPPAPTNLIASAGDGQVALTWAASYGATNYFIKQSTVSGGSYLVVGTNADISFTNTGLNNGTIYYYVVSAQNVSGESTNSMEASARPVSLLPTQINLAIANNQMQFMWPQDHTGWQLQAQTNPPGRGLGTNWMMISGSGLTNQVTLPADAANGSVFFRLISP